MEAEIKRYNTKHAPTLKLFHQSSAQIRCIVGAVGSGKSVAGCWEICYYLPHFLFKKYGIRKTRWVVVRNTYVELIDTTQATLFDWFPFGTYNKAEKRYTLLYPNSMEVEILFRSCDRPDDIKKFKSLEVTGYFIDESIEVAEEIKRMLKNRIGRYPKKSPVRFGVEVTNPPDTEHPTYSQFAWNRQPPGPIPSRDPLEDHEGFWQYPRENEENLRPGYYDDLKNDYRDNPDWIDMYIEVKPGVLVKGKLVYNNYRRDYHNAKDYLIWSGGTIYRGWDNSGNTPACVLSQIPTAGHIQILREYHSEKEGIIDFASRVSMDCNIEFPGADFVDYGDPAGANRFSRREGGFTSNADLMRENCGINVQSSEQNLTARIQSVEMQLGKIDGILIDPRCTRLIDGFAGGYCYEKIQGSDDRYNTKPIKNKYSHVHDALQYVMVRLTGTKVRRRGAGMTRREKRRTKSATSVSWMGW